MDSISSRIAYVIKCSGLTKTEFSKRISVSQAFVSQMCSGASNPSDRTVSDICRVFGVDEIWLRTGEGQPFRERTKDEVLSEVFSRAKIGNEPRDRLIRAFARLPVKYYPVMEDILREIVARLDPPPDTGTAPAPGTDPDPAPAKKEETP